MCEEIASEIEIKDDGVIKTSRSVQVTPETPDVLITVSKDELMKRIKSFVQFKRKQIDISNQLEFSHPPNSDESTCARVNTVFVGGARHITTHVINNCEGPNGHLPNLQEQLWAELVVEGRARYRPELTSENVLMLNERIQDIENVLDCKDTTKMDLLQRIRYLETRILNLEGNSTEYQQKQQQTQTLMTTNFKT